MKIYSSRADKNVDCIRTSMRTEKHNSLHVTLNFRRTVGGPVTMEEETGRSWDCHTRCDSYKEFQAKNEKEKNVIKRKNPYYKSLSKEKFMKRNALNRNRRGRK